MTRRPIPDFDDPNVRYESVAPADPVQREPQRRFPTPAELIQFDAENRQNQPRKGLIMRIIDKFNLSSTPDAAAKLYSDGQPVSEPDTAGLPENYAGTQPPAGWCDETTAFHVPAELRPAYLDALNDPEGEQERRDWFLRHGEGHRVAVPTPGSSTGRTLISLDPGRTEHVQLGQHLARLETARKDWERTSPDSPANRRKAVWEATTTCQMPGCDTKDVSPIPVRDEFNDRRLCRACYETALQVRADQKAHAVLADGRTRRAVVAEFLATQRKDAPSMGITMGSKVEEGAA